MEIFNEGNKFDHQKLLETRKTNIEDLSGCTGCMATMTPYVLMLGLSCHSIFEGIALGMGNDLL